MPMIVSLLTVKLMAPCLKDKAWPVFDELTLQRCHHSQNGHSVHFS